MALRAQRAGHQGRAADRGSAARPARVTDPWLRAVDAHDIGNQAPSCRTVRVEYFSVRNEFTQRSDSDMLNLLRCDRIARSATSKTVQGREQGEAEQGQRADDEAKHETPESTAAWRFFRGDRRRRGHQRMFALDH